MWSGNKAASKSKQGKETGSYFSDAFGLTITIFVTKISMLYFFIHRICFHGISNHSGGDQRSCPKRTKTSQSCDVGRNEVRSHWIKLLFENKVHDIHDIDLYLYVPQIMERIYSKR